MKFSKLTKKLLLSALSLGLAVVTLTTTTYAWYTSSTTAKVNETQGEASNETSDSTLLISTDGTNFAKTADVTFGENATPSLVPVEWNGTKFVLLDGKDAAPTNYFQFTVHFRTTKTFDADEAETVNVYLTTLTITNAGASLKQFDNLLGANTSATTVPANATYAVDMVKALDLVIDNGTKQQAYELFGNTNTTYLSDLGMGSDTPNALEYYNQVMGESNAKELPVTQHVKSDSYSSGLFENYANKLQVTSLSEASLTDATKYADVQVTFTIFLNGWDQYCFDACKGQSFKLSLDFSTSNQ